MKQNLFKINQIPAILWGEPSDKVYIAVHGKKSCKEDAAEFAAIAVQKGWQVLSFDLPEHGGRMDEGTPCDVWNGVRDLTTVGEYARRNWSRTALFATSLGAYFSLLAYPKYPLEKCLFLSPILDMERLIQNMMGWFSVDEKTLFEKKKMPTSMGETLDWDYFTYVKAHPITDWEAPTAILYGTNDNLTEHEVLDCFVTRFNADLTTLPDGEHFFHTDEQLKVLRQWLEKNI